MIPLPAASLVRTGSQNAEVGIQQACRQLRPCSNYFFGATNQAAMCRDARSAATQTHLHGPGGGVAKCADGVALDLLGDLPEHVDLLQPRVALLHARHYVVQPRRALPAVTQDTPSSTISQPGYLGLLRSGLAMSAVVPVYRLPYADSPSWTTLVTYSRSTLRPWELVQAVAHACLFADCCWKHGTREGLNQGS